MKAPVWSLKQFAFLVTVLKKKQPDFVRVQNAGVSLLEQEDNVVWFLTQLRLGRRKGKVTGTSRLSGCSKILKCWDSRPNLDPK